jgi:hypothetical protein
MDGFIPGKSLSRRGTWTPVFALNLMVPLFFGWMVTQEGGRIGMGAGIALLWYLGYCLFGLSEACGRALVIGGVLVAVVQFCPILHILAGLASVGLADALWHGSFADMRINTEIGGFIATLVMGLLMMGVAAVIGAIGSLMFPGQPRVSPAPASHLYDRQLDG